MQTNAYVQWSHKYPQNHPVLIQSGIISNEQWANHVITDTIPRLAKVSDSAEMRAHGVHGWGHLTNLPGYTMDPWPLPNSSPELALYKVDLDFEFALRCIVKTLIPRERFRHEVCEFPCHIRKPANFGLPSCATDLGYKVSEIMAFCRDIEGIMAAFRKRDFKYLLEQYDIMFQAMVKRRFQFDNNQLCLNDKYLVEKIIPKIRESFLYDGTAVIADKEIHEFVTLLLAMRVRLVMALSMKPNFLGMPVNDEINRCRFDEAPNTTHASDVSTTLQRVQPLVYNRLPYGADITGMDIHTGPDAINLILYVLQECLGLTDEFVEWMRCLAFSPWVCNGIYHDPKKNGNLPFIKGLWTNPLYHFLAHINGLASGWIFTTLIGCLSVLSTTIGALFKLKLLPRDEASVARYLKWDPQLPVFQFDQSDDQLLWVLPQFAKKIEEELPQAMNETNTGYKVSLDKPGESSYLSNAIVRNVSKNTWEAEPDPVRAISKTLIPEASKHNLYRNAHSQHNEERALRFMGVRGEADKSFVNASTKYPSFGLKIRNDEYMKKNPVFAKLWGTVEDSLDAYDPNVTRSIKDLARLEQIALESQQVEAKNLIDAEVLEEPSKALWKYTEDEISDGVFKLCYAEIPVEYVRKLKPVIIQ